MKRLVYSPQVNAWIKSDSGIFDLSPYITDFSINRKINEVSTAELTFRNPKIDIGEDQPRFLFTQHKKGDQYGPMFHPMDPIVITLTRIKGYPVQVFTGYCDKTPYIQLYPGVAKIKASCTLKRLLYTYWDPGLPFVLEWLADNGWYNRDGQTFQLQAEVARGELNDSSIGYLLYKVLQDIGNWEHKDIFIQDLPGDQITSIVEGLYEDVVGEAKASFEDMKEFLSKTILSDNNLGGGGASPSSDPSTAAAGNNTNPGTIDNTWESVADEYSGGNYKLKSGSGGKNVGYMNYLLKNAPQSGRVPNDRKIVEDAAKRHQVPFAVLWATYGAESSWGKAKSYFGLTGNHPGTGTTGNFESDANEAALTWKRIYVQKNNKNPDY